MSTKIKEGKVDTSFLKRETVIIQYIPKPTPEITNPNHVAYGGKLEGTYDYIAPPRLRKDQLKNILTDREKEGLEYLMQVDLSIYGDFWKSYKKDGIFPIALGKEDLHLDLSVAEQYIIYKVLLNTNLVANSIEEMTTKKRATYKYVIVKENETEEEEINKIDKQAEGFAFYGKIANNENALRFVLSSLGKHTHKGQDKGFMRKEIGKAIADPKDLEVILKLAKDKAFDTKVLLQEALTLGVINRISGQYFTGDNKPIAGTGEEPTLENAVKFLNSPVGQENRLAIEGRVKNARE